MCAPLSRSIYCLLSTSPLPLLTGAPSGSLQEITAVAHAGFLRCWPLQELSTNRLISCVRLPIPSNHAGSRSGCSCMRPSPAGQPFSGSGCDPHCTNQRNSLWFQASCTRPASDLLALGKVTEKTREITLHTEDIEDSICAVRSMAEFGLPIADDMIKDINKSLKIMSKTQPKRGLIQNPIWGFQSDKSSEPWNDLDTTNGGSSKNYLSSMLNTAKQKASSLRWPQTDFAMNDGVSEKSVSSTAQESSPAGGHGASTPSDAERDEVVSISNRLLENKNAATMNQGLSPSDISHTAESYNKFKEEQELKLQEWLRESIEAEDNRG